MTRAQAHYLRIFSGSTDYELWQNYYIDQTVTLDSKSFEFFPFESGVIQETSDPGSSKMSIRLPATQKAIKTFERALNNRRIILYSVYQFDTRLGNESPQAGQELITSFIGEVQTMRGTFMGLEVSLGSPMATVGTQVPPRAFTTALIGNPVQIVR